MEGVIEGRRVHYVLEQRFGIRTNVVGQHRAADILKVWDEHSGYVNLQVLLDGSNDTSTGAPFVGGLWVTSVRHSDGKEPGTWHFIEGS